jgi:hypothetical protein
VVKYPSPRGRGRPYDRSGCGVSCLIGMRYRFLERMRGRGAEKVGIGKIMELSENFCVLKNVKFRDFST